MMAALAGAAYGRGGGGCLAEGTGILTPCGPVAIQNLQAGQAVLAEIDGQLRPATVQALWPVQPEEFIELSFAGGRLLATAEHPVQTEPGVFRQAASLRAGQCVLTWRSDGEGVRPAALTAVRTLKADRPAYNLLVSPGGTFVADGVVVHNKGCFLPDTPILRADRTAAAIRDLHAGESLLAFEADGTVTTAALLEVLTHQADGYVEVTTQRSFLRVTPEHPFYVGQGTFKTLSALRVGDVVYAFDGQGLSPQRIVSMRRVAGAVTVYNLHTDRPNTFFANGIAVHNKGGGCFPAGTLVLTPTGTRTIEQISPGDTVVGIDQAGRPIPVLVEETFATRSQLLKITTGGGVLTTTAEHPLAMPGGGFRLASQLGVGDEIVSWRDGRAVPAKVTAIDPGPEETVYNLTVGGPHTFIAGGFIVHNKGGGGGFGGGGFGGGGYHSSGGGGGGSIDSTTFIIFVVVFAAFILLPIIVRRFQSNKEDEDLDFLYTLPAVKAKADKTEKLLDFIARTDQTMDRQALREMVQTTFLKLQQCWQARDYAPMQPLLMPDLYAQHCQQIQGMIHDHEIDVIENPTVERIDLVNVRYTHDPQQREFTALITASARDYYVDDRTQAFLRGDESNARFQEFWTFHLQGGQWLLREIEQTRESDVLKEENFFEAFTDRGLDGVYGDQAKAAGPAGPWLEKSTETKANKIERLLNFLVQTDKLWDRRQMLDRSRQVFMKVYLAQQAGDPSALPDGDLFPDVAQSLRQEISARQAKGSSIEYRNLCVRKADLVLVRNFSDNTQDEFVARISAHAQTIISRNQVVISQDQYVRPFEEYWVLGRLDGQWKLKEVLPPSAGQAALGAENVDQGSSPGQMQWYYSQNRAN
jgi:predicted lipid-binding transport protein (Tim44 family)/uncharacterized membrane protein YgcG